MLPKMNATNFFTSRTKTVVIGLLLFGVVSGGVLSASATPTQSVWCWSTQAGNVAGTFTMSPAAPGDGTAAAGTYTISDFSVYSSTFAAIEAGSISDGTYAFGTQPLYSITWGGTEPTSWNRQNGTYTNGLAISNGALGRGAYLGFGTNWQVAEETYEGVSIYYNTVTPTLFPVAASGLCPGQVANLPSTEPTPIPTSSAAEVESLASTGAGLLPVTFGFCAAISAGFALMLSARRRRKL